MASGHAHKLVEIHVQLYLDLLLVFTSVSVPNGWDRMLAHNDMQDVAFPCMRSTTLLTLFNLCQLLGWIHKLYKHNFIHLCMLHPPLYPFLLQLILSSMQLLFLLELFLQHMQLLLCFVLYLHAIFMSCHHLITWVSKVSFITSGSSLAYNSIMPLCCQQPSSCVHCIWYASLSCCWWWCLLVMLLPS